MLSVRHLPPGIADLMPILPAARKLSLFLVAPLISKFTRRSHRFPGAYRCPFWAGVRSKGNGRLGVVGSLSRRDLPHSKSFA